MFDAMFIEWLVLTGIVGVILAVNYVLDRRATRIEKEEEAEQP